jgi:hypothetical protein
MDKYSVKLLHEKTDPTVWIVNIYKNSFPFRKKIESKWFISEESARFYLNHLKYQYNLK